MKNWNRRDFFKQLTYGGAAIAFIPTTLVSCQQDLSAGDKNCIDLDGILPLSFINDCAQYGIFVGYGTGRNIISHCVLSGAGNNP